MTRLDDSLLALLAESDLEDEPELGSLLADLKALGAGPAPVPSAAVDALLAGSAVTRRGRHSRRGVIIGVLVLASIGTGVTAAAADPDLRAGAAGAVAAVVEVVHPHPAAVTPRHHAPAVVVPAAQPSPALSHDADPAAAHAVIVPRHAAQVAAPVARTGGSGGAEEHGTPSGRDDEGSGSGATTSSHGSGGSTGSGSGSGDEGSKGGSGGGHGGHGSGSGGSGSGSGGSGGSDDGGTGGSGSGGAGSGSGSGDGGSGGGGGDE